VDGIVMMIGFDRPTDSSGELSVGSESGVDVQGCCSGVHFEPWKFAVGPLLQLPDATRASAIYVPRYGLRDNCQRTRQHSEP
jgi:hypothetical protein